MHPFLTFTLQDDSKGAQPGFVPHSGGFLPSPEMIQATRTIAYPSWGAPTSQNKDTTPAGSQSDTSPFSSLGQNDSTPLHHTVAVGRPITTQQKFTVSDSNGRRNSLIIILRNQKEKHLIRDLRRRILTDHSSLCQLELLVSTTPTEIVSLTLSSPYQSVNFSELTWGTQSLWFNEDRYFLRNLPREASWPAPSLEPGRFLIRNPTCRP